MSVVVLEQPDYNELIDEQIWAFINRTVQCYPDDTTDRSIDEQRIIYNNMCRSFAHAYPEGVTSADNVISSGHCEVPVRRYKTSTNNPRINNTVLVYIHGGGFVVGDLNSHDDICAELCAKTGFNITSIDYRLSPEHLHPAAFEDCLICVEYEAQLHQAPVLLCGDSAGGSLAAAVAQRLSESVRSAEKIKLAGQVLIYPELGGDITSGSYLWHKNAPMLTADEVAFYRQVRVVDALPHADPSFAPLLANCFSTLPETVVVSAQCDPLSDDGKHYCDAIVQSGGQARWINEQGLVHGYLRARHSSVRAKASFETIVSQLIRLGTAVI